MDNEKLREELRQLRAKEQETAPPKELDKFQIATARFIDTVHGHFCGNHPVTTIDNARATCELIHGIAEHLKKKNRIPSDTYIIYDRKNYTNDETCTQTRLTGEMYKDSQKRSNFAKHADRDAHKTLSYNSDFDTEHLFFNMAVDYETLHSALIENGLLDTSNEKLYPIEYEDLDKLDKYKYIYAPHLTKPLEPKEEENLSLQALFSQLQSTLKDKKEPDTYMMPDAALMCTFVKFGCHNIFNPKLKAEKIRELGIWPVDMDTNASMTQTITPAPKNTPAR